MDSSPDIPFFDPRAVQSVLKIGGKRKLDTLIALLGDSAPARLQEIKAAQKLSEAKAAASALKNSAGNLGLARLEDLCDQVLGSNQWIPNPKLALEMESCFRQGHKALMALRSQF